VQLGVARLERKRARVARERLRMRSGLARDDAERAVRRRQLRRERERAPVRRRGAGRVAGVVEDDATVEVHLEIVGTHRDAALVAGQRGGDVACARGRVAEPQARFAEKRRDAPVRRRTRRERLEHCPRFGEATLAAERAGALDRRSDSCHACAYGPRAASRSASIFAARANDGRAVTRAT